MLALDSKAAREEAMAFAERNHLSCISMTGNKASNLAALTLIVITMPKRPPRPGN